MRKSLLVLALLWASSLNGAHNLLINGSSEAYLNYGDSITVSLYTEVPGAEVILKLFADVNNDGDVDTTEPLLLSTRVSDGSPFDYDEVANGYIETNFSSEAILGYISGDFILTAIENGVDDNAYLHFLDISSSLSVAGLVTQPSVGGITIFVTREISDTGTALGQLFGTYTDTSGSFYISIPDEYYGDTFFLLPVDVGGRLPNYVSPALLEDTIVLTGHISNLNISFTPTDQTIIAGNLIDNYGTPLSEPTRMLFMGAAFSLFDTIFYSTSSWSIPGYYSRNLKSLWGSFWHIIEDISPLYPHYLSPPAQDVLIFGTGSANVDFVNYYADTTIRGTVFVNGEPQDEVVIKTKGYKNGDEIGSTFTLSYSDGHYVLMVSGDVDSYKVYLDESSLPLNSIVEEDTVTAFPGDSNVNFHVIVYVPGDANRDGMVNSSDIMFLANYMYFGGPEPDPLWLGDENCDGALNFSDIVYLGNYLYNEGTAPVPCYPGKENVSIFSPSSLLRLIASKIAFPSKSLLK